MVRSICIDFDGVVHSCGGGWHGVTTIGDIPVPGAMQWLATLVLYGYQPEIFSVKRSPYFSGRNAMKAWIFDRMYDECYKIPPGTPMHDWRWKIVNGFTSAEPFDVQVFKAVKLFVRKLHFPKKMPACFIAVSTRSICFEGEFPTVEALKTFNAWSTHGCREY